MTANYLIKCSACGAVTYLKYQVGFVDRHPIRYKCTCGVTIRCFRNKNKIETENCEIISSEEMSDNQLAPAQIVFSSSELLTLPPQPYTGSFLCFIPGPFIFESGLLDIERFEKEMQEALSYKTEGLKYVRNCNELFQAKNYELFDKIARENLKLDDDRFPKKNIADRIRTLNYINHLQFFREDIHGRLLKTQDYYRKAFDAHREQTFSLAMFFHRIGKLEQFRNNTTKLANNVNDKLEYLIPAISIDYYKGDVREVLDSDKFLTTVSFEDVKSLYEDLYEHILTTAILAIGFDNILVRGNFYTIRADSCIKNKAKNLEDITKITKKGWILNYIDEGNGTEPIQTLICDLMNQGVRNSIGHFDYEEVPGTYGQKIRFLDSVKPDKSFEISLKEICYDIWQMYKCLAIIYELVYRLETLWFAVKGITVSSYKAVVPGYDFEPKYYRRPLKIYPNDPCPCKSGLKYKKCCGRANN